MRLYRLLLLVFAALLPWSAGAAPGTVLVLGDSLSAGFGISPEQGWVRLLAERIEARGLPWRVVNASISGDTTRGGLARLPELLAREKPALVILELGGNDGLRGLPLAELQGNLSRMIDAAKGTGARVLLLGMRIPPNYGPRYTERFHATYAELAERHGIPCVEFFLDGVAGEPALMQGDGIHPNAAAQQRLLENVWPTLVPMLRG